MQYHLNGFHAGDPRIAPQVQPNAGDTVDVLIVGCGPAGLTLAAQLSRFADVSVRIVERKSGPLEIGQADGIACRSLEMFQAFGFADQVKEEAYWVNEVAFWRPDAQGALHRADRIPDVEEGLSEMPHVVLSQARVHDFYLSIMANGARRLIPDYDCELTRLIRTQDADYPVHATISRSPTGQSETIRARYVVGCDGARSAVRAALGHELKGEAARQLWGVMDILAVTDFPDVRLKCAIQSADQGSMLIIPREGGYMVRMYTELDALHGDERAADRNLTAEALIAKARAILAPHTLDVHEVAWWSAYEIGQRVCDAFDDVAPAERGQSEPRIFIAGDACHTHSPKAGQGMNVSMADTFNLGWKLAAVLRGQSAPDLLDTYSAERRAKAKELIDFDRDMARLFSAKPKDAAEIEQFQSYFKKHLRYTAGVETRYDPSLITGPATHQALARGLPVGMRFHSAPVIRLGDAKPVHLGHAFEADGRWRALLFAPAGDHGGAGGRIAAICETLTDLARLYTPEAADIDSVIDTRAVFQGAYRDAVPTQMPPLLRPSKGRFGMTDYEKVYFADPAQQDIFDLRGIDRDNGALVLLRPDQFVAHILPLDVTQDLRNFLDGVFKRL